MTNASIYLNLAADAAHGAARLLQEQHATDAGVLSRAGRDLKTQADLNAEALILERLAKTGIPVQAEESGGALATTGLCWVVDPLDGTVNFSRGFPMFGVSIALIRDGQPWLGVIQDGAGGDLYTGEVGVGAWKNDAPMRVGETRDPAQAVLATGFPTGRDFSPAALAAFIGRVRGFKKIRMIGSAALSLAHVAAGVFDAYYEEDIYWWDVAAGCALVRAAGGTVRLQPVPGTARVHCFAGAPGLAESFPLIST